MSVIARAEHTDTSSSGPVPAPPRRPAFGATDLMLLGMALIWGVNFSVVKYGTTVLSPMVYNALRVSLAAIVLLLFTALIPERRPTRRDAVALLLLGLLGNGAYQFFFIEGLARTRAGTAALVLAATPAFIALISRIIGVERTSRRGVAGIALSLAGMTLVVLGSTREDGGRATMLGNMLVLAGCLCWSAFTVLLKPYTNRVQSMYVPALTMLSGAALQLLVALPGFARTRWAAVGAGGWLAVVYSGLGALGVAYYFWYRGVRVLGPTRTAMYSNLQPVIALLVAWPLLGEVPTSWQVVGVVSIMSGVVLTRA